MWALPVSYVLHVNFQIHLFEVLLWNWLICWEKCPSGVMICNCMQIHRARNRMVYWRRFYRTNWHNLTNSTYIWKRYSKNTKWSWFYETPCIYHCLCSMYQWLYTLFVVALALCQSGGSTLCRSARLPHRRSGVPRNALDWIRAVHCG